MKWNYVLGIVITLVLLMGCGTTQQMETPDLGEPGGETAVPQPEIDIPHLHGLGFSADGRQLIIPAHDGLRLYIDGQWQIPDVPAHDYMGFSASNDGFYSSGHPNPSAGLVNPFGLVKSTDGGQTLVKLGFEGETDFHLMAVGYNNHAIYVANPAANSKLPPGVHYSLDDGETWQQSNLQGITAQPIQMAVHPTEANRVALATEGGLFLSEDYGDSFEQVGEPGVVTALTFTPNGDTLLFGLNQLFAYSLAEQQITPLPTPPMTADDAISNIAVNPARPDEIALATYSKNIYLSADGGQNWTQIAAAGKATP